MHEQTLAILVLGSCWRLAKRAALVSALCSRAATSRLLRIVCVAVVVTVAMVEVTRVVTVDGMVTMTVWDVTVVVTVAAVRVTTVVAGRTEVAVPVTVGQADWGGG